MRTFPRLPLLVALALATQAHAQQYIGPTQALPPGCDSTNYLRGDNTCNVPGGSGGTVTSVGLSAPSWLTVTGSPVTGSGTLAIAAASGQAANSFVATPSGSTGAVSLRTITLADLPTGVAQTSSANSFSADQTISDAEPRVRLNETDQGTDQKLWDWDVNGAIACLRTRNDADSAGSNAFCATRNSTTGVTTVTIGNATDVTAYSFPGGGLTVNGVTSNGSISAPRLIANGSTPATVGMYLSASNTLGLSTASTLRVSIDGNGIVKYTAGQIDQIRVVTAAGAVTAATTDRHICVNKTTGAATTVNLFATPATGTVLTIDDCKGDAATNNITVTPAAGNIDGSTTFVINANYGSWTGIYTGTIWKTEASR